MKKIILMLTLLVLGFVPAYSQYDVYYSSPISFRASAYGGYNFAQKTPNVGLAASIAAYNLMGEIDAGWTKTETPGKSFLYLNPAIGFYFGEDYRIYALVGITNWGEYDLFGDDFRTDQLYCKIKIGVDIPIGRKVFVNINWSYIVNDNDHYRRIHDRIQFKSNNLAIGLGYRF